MNTEAQEWYEFNAETIQALTDDGTDISQDHLIEHHLASQDFDLLEKAAVDAFKAGFEVTDAEELVLDDGGTVFCFDAIVEKKRRRPNACGDEEGEERHRHDDPGVMRPRPSSHHSASLPAWSNESCTGPSPARSRPA